MPDTQLIPPACVAAVRTNDFGPDYAEKIARAVLDAFVAGEGAGRWRVVCDPDDSVNEYLVVTGHGSGGMRCLHCGRNDKINGSTLLRINLCRASSSIKTRTYKMSIILACLVKKTLPRNDKKYYFFFTFLYFLYIFS